MSRRGFGLQRGDKLKRNSTAKLRVLWSFQRQLNNEQNESKCCRSAEQNKVRNIETEGNNKQSDTKCSARKIELETCIQQADRETGNVEQNKARFKIETETIS